MIDRMHFNEIRIHRGDNSISSQVSKLWMKAKQREDKGDFY